MNTKISAQVLNEVIANLRCCICLTKTDIVCKECLAREELAGFCEKHQERHKTERFHTAFWGQLEEDIIES